MSSLKASLLAEISQFTTQEIQQVLALLKKNSEKQGNDNEWIRLDEGLAIYKQKASKYWWVRIYHNSLLNKETRRSTRETDKNKAIQIAYNLQSKLLGMAENGLYYHDNLPKVKDIAKKVIKELKEAHVQKTTYPTYISILENHIIPKVGNLVINQLDLAALKSYFNSTTRRSSTGIKTAKTCFSLIYDHAVTARIINQRDVPTLPKVTAKETADRREEFDPDDLKTILDNIHSFSNTTKNKKSQSYRKLLLPYILFLLETGARPGLEVLSLQWKDIKSSNSKINKVWTCRIRKGKTKNKGVRPVVLSAKAIMVILSLYVERYHDYVDIEYIKKKHPNDFIFSSRETQTTTDMTKIFQQYQDYLGDKITQRYHLYSARHSHINNALRKGISIWLIAQNVGTSPSTIEKHYKRYKPELSAGLLIDMDEVNSLLHPTKQDHFSKLESLNATSQWLETQDYYEDAIQNGVDLFEEPDNLTDLDEPPI
ncbi:MAG: site-specific integrase [Gammaproteobacteria bacterium]|nr:site-specific integrase [Gammaproteobacteria bacterium]